MSDLLERARNLAHSAHSGQTDKAGNPYVLHPLRVACDVSDRHGENHPAVIVALLHDVVEDTECRLDTIRELFGSTIAQAVDAVTKRQGEALEDYYCRVKANPLALIVKAADIRDNTSLERLGMLNDEEAARLRAKYAKARRHLGID